MLIEDTLCGMEKQHKANIEVQLHQLKLAEAHERREIEAEAQRVELGEEDCKLWL